MFLSTIRYFDAVRSDPRFQALLRRVYFPPRSLPGVYSGRLPMSLSPGTRLGSYEVTALIDHGGMGEVYKATDTRLDRAALTGDQKWESSDRCENP